MIHLNYIHQHSICFWKYSAMFCAFIKVSGLDKEKLTHSLPLHMH